MGLSDKLKQFGEKAKESATEHREQIATAVQTAGAVADKRTRGRYSDKIAKATSKTEAAVDRLAGRREDDDVPSASSPPPPASAPPPPASAPPPPPQQAPPPTP